MMLVDAPCFVGLKLKKERRDSKRKRTTVNYKKLEGEAGKCTKEKRSREGAPKRDRDQQKKSGKEQEKSKIHR